MSTPPITLYSNPASPFGRKVAVMLHETGQFAQVQIQACLLTPVNPVAELNQENPAGKIPALRLADGSVVHDSRVILDYLDHQHSGEPLIPRDGPARWRRLTLASLADALMDAAVLIRYETALRPEAKHWDVWLGNQAEKIHRSLAYFEAVAGELAEGFDVAGIGAACALGYLDFRQPQLEWRAEFPALAAWYAQVSQRASMQLTRPPA